MTRRCWFAYEEDQAGQPVPVVFYDDIPKSSGKRRILQSEEIPEHQGNEFSFSLLQKLYPYLPQQGTLQSTTSPVVLKKEEEINMTRPVTGYLTAQGKFFESLNEANLYEARYVLNKAAGMAVMELGVQGEENIREAIQNLVTFINENTDIIEGYISARRALAAEYPDNEVDGPPTTSDQTDDTQVRDEPDMEMEPPPETEASTETVGESTEQETVPF